jgi:hypothetical protein
LSGNEKTECRRPENFLKTGNPVDTLAPAGHQRELKVFVPGIKQCFFLEGEGALALGRPVVGPGW